MAKYKVKDINKNGKIDGWEQAKYDAINKSSEKESPLDFFGGNIAASIGMASNAMAQARKARRTQASNVGNVSGRLDEIDSRLSAVEGLNAESASQPEMTNVPPAQANTLGQAQPVFNPQAQQAAQGVYGGIDQRQNSVGAAPLFKKCNKKY